MKYKKKLNRDLHRDMSYFFLGLIISFSISGIMLAHRSGGMAFDKYEKSSEDFTINMRKDVDVLSKNFPEELSQHLGLEPSKDRRLMIKGNRLTMSYTDYRVRINTATGKGSVTVYADIPVLAQIKDLHTSTDDAWKYYADFFAIGMLAISITGVLIPMGKRGFKKRGWKFAVAGIIFPLIIAIFVL